MSLKENDIYNEQKFENRDKEFYYINYDNFLGWNAFCCGIVSSGFKSEKETLYWILDKFNEEMELTTKKGAEK